MSFSAGYGQGVRPRSAGRSKTIAARMLAAVMAALFQALAADRLTVTTDPPPFATPQLILYPNNPRRYARDEHGRPDPSRSPRAS
ncbi:MAG: hypothetical protein ACHRXM_37640 [Isosphaerales bacterium]